MLNLCPVISTLGHKLYKSQFLNAEEYNGLLVINIIPFHLTLLRMWGTLLADIVIQMLGTDYARIVQAIYAFAQVNFMKFHLSYHVRHYFIELH